jgi:hypothetical protein
MREKILIGTVALLATCVLAADPSSEGEVKAAAKKLADSGSYSWKTTTDVAGGGRFRPGPTEGKIAKDGVALLAITRGENTTQAVLKGDKGAIKTDDGWMSLSDLTGDGGQPNRAAFMARALRSFKTPAAEAEDLLAKAKGIQKSEGVYTGDLSEEGVKELLTRGFRRPGGDAPAPKDAKGSVKFWLKEGMLSKYEFNVQGKIMGREDREFEINRTTTVEIKDVGTTKVEVPEDAMKKLS